MVFVLLRSGAEKNALDQRGQTPLMFATRSGHLPVVETLLAAGSDINVRTTDSTGVAALHLAASFGHGSVVCALLRSGAEKDTLDANGNSPLIWASNRGHLVVVEILLAAGADLTIRTIDDGAFAILEAAGGGYGEIVSVLLTKGADKESLNDDGHTPLIIAAGNGHLPVVEILLTAGADVNTRSTADGRSALDMAADQGHARILKAILGGRANPNAQDEDGYTALHIAAVADQAEAIEALISAGADIESKTSDDETTPLLSAASSTACNAMLALLQHGATVNARDGDGYTALHLVCDQKDEGLEAAVGLLLRWEADEMELDDQRQTPADILGLPSGANDEQPQCSQDEIDRVRLLLARAPADRAWRRRGWLIMASSRASKERAAGCDTKHGLTHAGGAASRKVARLDDGAEGALGGAHESTILGDGSGARGEGTGLAGVLTALLELELEGVFRAVVSFL